MLQFFQQSEPRDEFCDQSYLRGCNKLAIGYQVAISLLSQEYQRKVTNSITQIAFKGTHRRRFYLIF